MPEIGMTSYLLLLCTAWMDKPVETKEVSFLIDIGYFEK
jgi:hypothetical protein